ncbi:hypothetical protein HY358_00915 [Candidatus Roizmanbacteria bacterium]|nr:hypothetical protein [Candidatus Roizmanbacteria bacterium]
MKYHINLFPRREKNIIDKGIYFSFHYLRYILVITQIVVIIVFFYRFKVDQEKIDLKEALTQKEEILLISEPIVKEARIIEKKVGDIHVLLKNQLQFSDAFEYVLSIFPEKITLHKLAISRDDGLELTGKTTDVNVVRAFYNRLIKDKRFLGVELSGIKKEPTGFTFSLFLRTTNTPKKT